ncbi:hypothetical protein, unlikely [Trypanosoma brucei gambiense DAL972]|uniref:Uncharacterized protein n=1 Tax=Trypanosoma brucei gambiense (strain MHOM/CI/86/DAL972) TaxID=679716 RepID=D0A207_TRYB9|nr:hypothetical protein, unlikely [Trypanosoma brucei gambiense DAL972]CBH15300.1 hypothetical protein, unlikely [Trypanosoma brucei gambiense DAL972]|eukprot:XP_011777565.1 hypothetical protein, unlikely [Trypanosoma brucei gambiense DAL972]
MSRGVVCAGSVHNNQAHAGKVRSGFLTGLGHMSILGIPSGVGAAVCVRVRYEAGPWLFSTFINDKSTMEMLHGPTGSIVDGGLSSRTGSDILKKARPIHHLLRRNKQ